MPGTWPSRFFTKYPASRRVTTAFNAFTRCSRWRGPTTGPVPALASASVMASMTVRWYAPNRRAWFPARRHGPPAAPAPPDRAGRRAVHAQYPVPPAVDLPGGAGFRVRGGTAPSQAGPNSLLTVSKPRSRRARFLGGRRSSPDRLCQRNPPAARQCDALPGSCGTGESVMGAESLSRRQFIQAGGGCGGGAGIRRSGRGPRWRWERPRLARGAAGQRVDGVHREHHDQRRGENAPGCPGGVRGKPRPHPTRHPVSLKFVTPFFVNIDRSLPPPPKRSSTTRTPTPPCRKSWAPPCPGD
ncbi:hypothetical protein JOF53_001219 [Crossiella equi]|uniref:Uncharacterized protein n=1 Tax=Crossiella equi TaxID=130796 RepID=A0ABS5A7U6_9PSEU|nr:hypothetical protein [Crossiella equi]